MEWFSLDLLTSPAVVFTATTGLFLILVRSPWPWTRMGGSILGLLCCALLALALRDPEHRETLRHGDRFVVLLMIFGSCSAAWLAFHQISRTSKETNEEASTWRGLDQTECLLGGFVITAVAAAAFLFGAPLSPAAASPQPFDGFDVPWFLLGLQELTSFFDPWIPWLLLPFLTILGLWALPYLDVPTESTEPTSDDFNERRDVVYFFLFVWFLLGLLPMATAFIQPAQPFMLSLGLARPLSEILWELALEHPPRPAWLRELPSLLTLSFYFFVLPRQLPRWKRTRPLFGRYMKRLGARRFYLAMAFMQLWMLVPLKMYGFWLLNIGYFVYLPELSFSF